MSAYDSPYDPSSAPEDLKFVIYEKKGHVAYVTINRPEVRNALHSYSYAVLRACWRDIGLAPIIYCGFFIHLVSSLSPGHNLNFHPPSYPSAHRTPLNYPT